MYVRCPSLDAQELSAGGFLHDAVTEYFHLITEGPWYPYWKSLVKLAREQGVERSLQVAILPNEGDIPQKEDIQRQLRPYDKVQEIAAGLWLGEALLEDRLVSFLQPIVDAENRLYGYEALARVREEDGSIINGWDIMVASKALNLEFRLDRLLHQKSIEAFLASGLHGRLFVNFVSGFIHRPSVYLDGLTQEVERAQLPPHNIVLELTRSEMQDNMEHLKSISAYCKEKGYGIAMDDISTFDYAEPLIEAVKPDIIKLDRALTQDLEREETQQIINSLIQFCHDKKVTVIGECIETEEMFSYLKAAKVDLFQGYYIGPPAPVGGSEASGLVNKAL
jgi:EAL domain-containing protein (putative c-di-GMP-specific phosphodiesterase class I)